MPDEPVASQPPNPPAGAFTASPPTPFSAKADPTVDAARQAEAAQRAATLKRIAALRQARVFRILEWAMIPVVLALAFMLGSFAVHNSDFWMHLATGRLIVNGEYKFGHDPFGFGTEDRYWVNHSWAYDWLLYQVWKADQTGAASVVLKAVLLMLTAGFMLLACRPASPVPSDGRANVTGWLAALLTGVALVAAAPRFLLQPTVISFLFVAITLCLLMRTMGRPTSWRLPAALGILFALWVNLDAWFILGPALVALFFVGELLQRVLPGEAPGGSGRLKVVGICLVVGILACLLNPHTWHAFALPADLYAPQLVDSFRTDESFRFQFISPFDHRFYSDIHFGRSYSGWFYFGLLGLGIAAFAVNFGRLRWSLVLTWLAMAGISALNSRAIPFFAIVAAPITVWNLHAVIARWTASAENEPPAEPSLEEVPARGGVSVTPETVESFLALMGRLLTLALGLAAVVLAWPGWLTPDAPAWQDRRVAWRAEPDVAHKLAAEQIQRWREEGRLPDSVHGFQNYPDPVNYAAWFAPKEKGFFDYRYSLLGDRSSDFIDVRRALKEIAAQGKQESPALGDVFRKYGIGYLVLDLHDRRLMAVLLPYMYVHPEEWSIWYLNGEVIIAGWRDKQLPVAPPKPQDSFSGLKQDFVRAAFGPETERIPPPTVGQLQPDPETTIPPRTSWDNFLSASPLVPLEAAHADQYLLLGNVATNMGANRILFTNEVAQRASEIAIHASPDFRALPATLPFEVWVRGTNPNLARVQVWYRDDAVPALAVLATRAARKGIALHPDDPVCYFELARAYDDFARGSQLQNTEKMVALQQGLARLTPDMMTDNWVIEQVYGAYPQLFQLYNSSGHFDLAVETMQKSLELLKRSPPPNRTAEEIDQILKAQQQQVQRFEKELSARSDRYELDSRNQPASNRVAIARRYGLTKEVVRLLEAEAAAERLERADGLHLAQTYLELGQVEQAWGALGQIEKEIGVEKLEPPHQAFFRYLKIGIATARGDFAEAIKEVDRFLANQEKLGEQLQWSAKIISALTAGYSYDLINQNPFVRWQSLMVAGKLLADAAGFYEQMASGYALLAILELEYGDNEGAKKHFALAVRQGAPFEGGREAQRYSELLQKALRKTSSASTSPTTP